MVEASVEPHEVIGDDLALRKSGAYDWDVELRVSKAVGRDTLVHRRGRARDRASAVRAVLREIEDAL
jgi:hypothetical protein